MATQVRGFWTRPPYATKVHAYASAIHGDFHRRDVGWVRGEWHYLPVCGSSGAVRADTSRTGFFDLRPSEPKRFDSPVCGLCKAIVADLSHAVLMHKDGRE